MPALMPLVLVSLLAAAPQQAPPVPETVAIPAGKIKAGHPARDLDLRAV